MSLKLQTSTREVRRTLKAMRGIVQRPFVGERGRSGVAAIRKTVAQEFSQGGGFTSSGAVERWPRTLPFGSRPAPGIPLGGIRGSLATAWRGGPGGFSTNTPTSLEVGINRPDAVAHRGGELVPKRTVTRIRAKAIGSRGLPRMFWALGLGFGVWISAEKLRGPGLALPSRPHADPRAPQFGEALVKIIVDALDEVNP